VNRNRPPAAMPAPGFQTPLFAGAQHAATQQAQPLYSPECLEALIRQSESNYMIARERTMKFDEGAGTLEMETQNMSIELANRGMTSSHDPMLRANEVMRQEMRAHRSLLDALLRSELALQGNFKRWASGQMPALSNPAASMFNAPMPPPPPIPGGQYSQSAATMAQAQGPFQPQQGFAPPPPGVPPPMPLGAVDYRDPRQAAEALLRAAPMPMVPQAQPVLQQQQPQAPYPYPQPNQASQAPPFPWPYQGQQPMPPQAVPQYAYPSPQQQPMPQHSMPTPMEQQQVAPAQPPPMPTSMQFEQPPPAQQTPHQAAVNGAAKA
jgi:hypothetical protein